MRGRSSRRWANREQSRSSCTSRYVGTDNRSILRGIYRKNHSKRTAAACQSALARRYKGKMTAAITARPSRARMLKVLHAASEFMNSTPYCCVAIVCNRCAPGKWCALPVPTSSISRLDKKRSSSRVPVSSPKSFICQRQTGSVGVIIKLPVTVLPPTDTAPELIAPIKLRVLEVSA